ncbi:type II toxin-antitoxin system PemK/MazF family toxin, partial [bacterium]|nr:type II toxin-antitoxin system PemK/MazF family toxin [bacterium]
RKFHVYTANLNPRFGTESGKLRPVVVIQTDLLNPIHPSTIVCPISTTIHPESDLLRVHLRKGEAGLENPSDVLVDQARAIDNKRFVKHLGTISDRNKLKLLDNLRILVLE